MKAFISAILLCGLLYARSASAQALPTHNEQLAADIASYVTLGIAEVQDTRASWNGACTVNALDLRLPRGSHRIHCFEKQGLRLSTTWLTTAILKHYVPRERPCAPNCGIDSPYSDFPSGHSAFAFSTGRWYLAIGTGELRMLANKHDLLGVLSGAGIGLLTSRIQ